MIEIGESSGRHEADESPERRATSSYALASHQTTATGATTTIAKASRWPWWTGGASGCDSVQNRPVPGQPTVTRRPRGPTVSHAPRCPTDTDAPDLDRFQAQAG